MNVQYSLNRTVMDGIKNRHAQVCKYGRSVKPIIVRCKFNYGETRNHMTASALKNHIDDVFRLENTGYVSDFGAEYTLYNSSVSDKEKTEFTHYLVVMATNLNEAETIISEILKHCPDTIGTATIHIGNSYLATQVHRKSTQILEFSNQSGSDIRVENDLSMEFPPNGEGEGEGEGEG